MNYVNEQIFTDNRLNILADKLFYYLDQKFTFNNVKEKFLLTGKVSALLQGHGTSPASNFIFITNDSEIYIYLLLKVNDFMKAKMVMKFKERIVLDFGYCKIEVWNYTGNFSFVNFEDKDIYIEEYNKIQQILL